MSDGERRLGLTLGGGGGKGAAHIGVLMALEALRVPIDVLSGTSIGAMVAALYAIGNRPYQIEQWFHRVTARRILERDPTNGGMLGTRKIEALFREAFGSRTFADATIPLAVVAVDVGNGTEVVLRDGSLVDALLASTAIPGVFPPVVLHERSLIDGGVLNNVPVDVAYALGADRVIAVDLGVIAQDFRFTPQQAGETLWSPRRLLPRNQLLLAERAISIMTAQITAQRLAQQPPIVLLRPVVSSLLPFDFTRTLDGRLLGERAVFEQRQHIEELRDWRNATS